MHTRAQMRLGLQLALAGMLLRALLPAGWMPASSFSHGTWLEVCDGVAHAQGRQAMNMVGMPPRPHQHQSDPGPHRLCPFAAAAHLGAAGSAMRLSPVVLLGWRLAQETLRHLVFGSVVLDAASPRGPPQLS
ncbi:MAG: hypothetical protein KGO02_09120 [Alphaproteobacteria bacterium]|nr:hypothetical protein [Alphaproteobacteria bacterium]